MKNYDRALKPMKVKVEDLTNEFLRNLTKTHAIDICKGPDSGTDDQNWAKAEKLTTLNIIEIHVEQCKKGSSLFRTRDFNKSFFENLEKSQNDISKYLKRKLSITFNTKLDEELNNKINHLIAFDKDLYKLPFFNKIELSKEAHFLKNKTKLKPHELLRLNRVLLEDAYPKEIAKSNECPEVTESCLRYFNLTNIQQLKKYKAHMIWSNNGRTHTNSLERQVKDYLCACNQIIWFCDDLRWKGRKCNFNSVLNLLDRRKDSYHRRKGPIDRRNYHESIENIEITERRAIPDRRWITDRRICDHRGAWAAACLK